MISIKSEREIELLRIAGNIVYQTHQYLKDYVKPGITTKELDKLAYDFIISHDATPSFLNYNGFPASICTSINEEVVHGIPGNRKLKNGDIISGSYDHTAKIWKKGKDNPEATLEGHEFTVFDISECKNGNILTASGDGTIKLWDIKTKKCIQTFIGHSDYVVSLHSTKGNVFISGSYDNTAIIWTIKY